MNAADTIYNFFFKDMPEDERPERSVVECGVRKINTEWTDEMIIDLVKVVPDELLQELYGQTKEEFLKACSIVI